MKKLIAVLCVILLLSGCSQTGGETLSAHVSLPTPVPEPENQFLGEIAGSAAQEVNLYYLSGDGASLSSVTRTVTAEDGEVFIEQVAEALLSSPGGSLTSAAPDGTRLLSLEQSGEHVTVDLSVDSLAVRSEAEKLFLAASVANTLLGLDGISSVSILAGGAAYGVAGLPLGIIDEPILSVSGMLAELEAEYERAQSGAGDAAERKVAVYRISGGLFVPEIMSVAFGAEVGLETLAQLLSTGEGAVFASPFAVSAPSVAYVNASGTRVLRIHLSSAHAAEGVTAGEAAAAAILTTTTFLPGVDGVLVKLDGVTMTECTVGGVTVQTDGGLFRREQFARFIGREATLYFSSGDSLVPVSRTMTHLSAASPRLVLEALFSTPLAGEGRSPFPDGVRREDVLGVRVENGVATVNLSAAFYARCQALDVEEEQIAVYAIVNTLTQLEQIRGVRILIEGKSVGNLAGNVNISSVLIENPGIAADPAAESSF